MRYLRIAGMLVFGILIMGFAFLMAVSFLFEGAGQASPLEWVGYGAFLCALGGAAVAMIVRAAKALGEVRRLPGQE